MRIPTSLTCCDGSTPDDVASANDDDDKGEGGVQEVHKAFTGLMVVI